MLEQMVILGGWMIVTWSVGTWVTYLANLHPRPTTVATLAMLSAMLIGTVSMPLVEA